MKRLKTNEKYKNLKAFLIKNKVAVVSISLVFLLACVSVIISYAFYSSTGTQTIVGGEVGKIPDLEVRVMVEDRDANGNGIGTYSKSAYIPKAGYEYSKKTRSYCTNGSTLTYNSSEYSVTVNASGHDLCYVYFDSIASLDLTLNVYLEDVDANGNGLNTYNTKLETEDIPAIGYKFNSSMSSCTNGSSINYNDADHMFIVEASGKDVCNAYMDAMDVDVAVKLYVQAKRGSTFYYEATEIPNTAYYALNTTKSGCTGETGSATLSIENQRIVINTSSKTKCVAYLDVADGPIYEESKVNINGNSATFNFTSSSSGTPVTRWYYSVDNGKTYNSTTASSVTATVATGIEHPMLSYGVDASGRKSAIRESYYYSGLFPYETEARTKVIEESGYYYLQVWGAQGGYRNSAAYAGKGGYSYGYIYLNKGDTLYVTTGGHPGHGTSGCGMDICPGGTNGGGYRYKYYGGGGATDIRVNSNSLYARVIVAGGGGSDGSATKYGYYGGGTVGGSSIESFTAASNHCGKGGNETYSGYSSAYTAPSQATTGLSVPDSVSSVNQDYSKDYLGGFGFGGGGFYRQNGYGGAGGGGWYGGAGTIPDGSVDDDRGGGGGSGYVFTAANASKYPAGRLVGDEYFLVNASTIAGNTSFEAPSGAGATETGHAGNGYAKVTYIGKTL